MENNQQLQRVQGNTPAFLRDATSSLEKMQSYAKLLADSELLPKHFYKLDQYKKPMKDAHGKLLPNVPAIIMTIQHGLEVGMSISQALQQIVPIGGVTSIKGDGAMALIQNSGLCVFWKEEVSGSIEKEDYTVKLHAKHKNGREKHIEFGVYDAKRLGLWVTEAAVQKNENLRHGGWWKTPKRMIAYRALGYMARDLFPEVMQGMYTEEEARDFNEDNTTFITNDGIKVSVTDAASDKMVAAAKDAIDNAPVRPGASRSKKDVAKLKEPVIEEAVLVTEEEPEPTPTNQPEPEQEQQQEETRPEPHIYTKVELDALTPADLLGITNSCLGINADEKLFTGDNKSKRVVGWLKKLILASQNGTLAEVLEKEFKTSMEELQSKPDPTGGEMEKVPSDYELPEPDARGFQDILKLDTMRKEAKMSNEDVMAFITEQELGYDSVESFFKLAPSDTVLIALGR